MDVVEHSSCELIDTLWNVNTDVNTFSPVEIGINRYIMECKLWEKCCDRHYRGLELIDTLWNVNTPPQVLRLLSHYELIDTLWNVNTFLYWE